MKRYLFTLRFVLGLTVLISCCSLLVAETGLSDGMEIFINVLRALPVLLAGWLVTTRNVGGLWAASVAGALVLFIDHVVVAGTYFLFRGGFTIFGAVLFTYVAFVWVAMLVAFAGGLAGNLRLRHEAASRT